MSQKPSRSFRATALVLSLSVLFVAVLLATGSMLFGSKFGPPMFPMSADALAAYAEPRAADGGPAPDAGYKTVRFLGATKAAPIFQGSDLKPEPAPQPSPAQQEQH